MIDNNINNIKRFMIIIHIIIIKHPKALQIHFIQVAQAKALLQSVSEVWKNDRYTWETLKIDKVA